MTTSHLIVHRPPHVFWGWICHRYEWEGLIQIRRPGSNTNNKYNIHLYYTNNIGFCFYEILWNYENRGNMEITYRRMETIRFINACTVMYEKSDNIKKKIIIL